MLEKVPSVICMVSPQQLQHYLSCFVLEARKKDGTEYHPDTLYHIVCDVIQFLRENGQPEVEFFKVHIYDDFRSTLDSRMKRLKQAGMGSCKCQAEPLTEEEEEVLWEKGILGDHSPKALLNSLFLFNGVCFVLRSAEEH